MANRGIVLVEPTPSEFAIVNQLLPGSYLVVLGKSEDFGIVGRVAGLELRDTLLVISEGPRFRYAFLFRKALEKPSVAEQVLATGTGGLNVDACRIVTQENRGRPRGTFPHSDDAWGNGHLAYTESHLGGRWPANVVLVHGAGCKLLGTRKIEGHKGYPNGPGGSSSQFSQKGTKTTRTGAWAGHADAEGKETVAAWNCQFDCPVRVLDVQSGERPSTLTGRADPTIAHENPGDNHGASTFGGGNSNVYADTGGASRFYPQVANDAELRAWLERLIGVE